MAVKLITTIQRWLGLTADTKPTSAPIGSTYLDHQTGILYITYDGGTTWVEWAKRVQSAQLPTALAAGGGLKVEGVAGGVAQPVTANQGTAGAAAWPIRLPAAWSTTQASGVNAAQTITKAAVPAQRYYITGFTVSLWGAPAAQEIEAALNDGVTKVFSAIIGEGASTGERLTEQFSHPIEMGVNTAVTLVIDAGGAGVGTIANLLGYTL